MMLKNGKEAEKKTGPTNVAFYLRVSDDKQAAKEDGSIDTQGDLLSACLEYKRKQGLDWRLSEKLVEGEKDGKRRGKSAKDTHRPGFQRLLQLARAGLIDVIMITKIDRISRSVVDFLLMVDEFDKFGVRVVSLKEQIDLTTPAGRFQTILMIALAAHEREMTAARVKEKVDWRAEKGFPLGPPPSGYVMKDKMFEIDETFAGHVREGDRLYLEHESADRVVVEFRKRGRRTPKGKFYNKPMIIRMLRNPTYTARIERNGKVFDAQWKPIRSLETHEKIQKTLDRNHEHNRSSKRQPSDYVYVLQGLVRCGACGYKMSPKSGTGRNGSYYPYYVCGNAEKSRGDSCPLKFVPAEAMDRAALEFLKELHLKPERLQAFARRANEFTSGTVGKLKADLERVHAQLTSVKTKLGHMADAIEEGGKAALGTLKERLEAHETEREELEAMESRLKTELAAEQTQEVVVQDQIRTLGLFHELVAKSEAQPDRIKMILSRFVDYVVWHAEVKGEGQLEVALLAEPVALSPEILDANGAHRDGPGFAPGYQVVGPPGLEPGTKGL